MYNVSMIGVWSVILISLYLIHKPICRIYARSNMFNLPVFQLRLAMLSSCFYFMFTVASQFSHNFIVHYHVVSNRLALSCLNNHTCNIINYLNLNYLILSRMFRPMGVPLARTPTAACCNGLSQLGVYGKTAYLATWALQFTYLNVI